MAGYDNIKEHGFDKIPAERQREIAKMGAAAATKKRKQKKRMKELFQEIGNMAVTDVKIKARMKAMGIPEDDITWQAAVAVATIMAAVKKNDPKVVEFVLEMFDDDIKGGGF